MQKKDVIVVGGGPTGIAASVAAARCGAKTLLIERYGFLGGMTTAGLVSHWDPIELMEITGIARELYHLLKERKGVRDFPYQTIEMPFTYWEAGCGIDAEIYKYTVMEVVKNAGVELLLHAFVTDVIKHGNQLQGVIVQSKSGKQGLYGTVIVDATGDGDVGALAGAPYQKGTKEGELMSATLSFSVGGVDTAILKQYLIDHPEDFGQHPRLGKFLKNVETSAIWQGFHSLIDQGRKNGDLSFLLPEQGIGMARLPIEGQFHVNATRSIGIDGTKVEDLTRGEWEQRHYVYKLFLFMQKYIPGFENAFNMSTATQIGIRETRRIKADYFLTLDDVQQGKRFDDVILHGKWAHSDIHSGKDMQWQFDLIEGPYQVPYRCLLPQGLEHLMIAGRSIWVERNVIGSLRIQPMCMATGQAAGVAAAIAAKSHQGLREIEVKEIQRTLRDQGVYIP
jgi:hypothetical protein